MKAHVLLEAFSSKPPTVLISTAQLKIDSKDPTRVGYSASGSVQTRADASAALMMPDAV
jgi:hypothetical protein